MPKHVLVVHSDEDVREEVTDILKDLGDAEQFEVYVDQVRSQQDAEKSIQKQKYDLVITNLEIPYDRKSPLPAGRKEKPGLELVKSLRQQKIDVPAIVLVVHVDEDLFWALRELPNVDVTLMGEKLKEDLTQKSKSWLSQGKTTQMKERVDLDIILNLDTNEHLWSLHCGRFGLPKMGKLFIDRDELEDLVTQSQAVDTSKPKWENMLKVIGESLGKYIFSSDKNHELARYFYESRGLVGGGMKNTRIRFLVEQKIHPIILEALKEPKKEEEFWMLEAPIYRRLQTHGQPNALFQDSETRKEPLNCLIIQANVSGEVDGYSLRELKNVEKEAVWLKGYLNEHKDQFNIGKVSRLYRATAKRSFRDALEHTLESGEEWHIVHYAGHSIYDTDKGIGYIFLP